MPLPAIPITPADRVSSVAAQIVNIINNAEAQVKRLRADQAAVEARPEVTIQTPQGPRVQPGAPALPAIAKADIDAKLGPAVAGLLDTFTTALDAAAPAPAPAP